MKHAALVRATDRLKGLDVLVSFSGGKDSWIVLDLAVTYAKRVEAFTMELVSGLRVFDRQIELAEARYGLKVRRYPHWLRARYFGFGTFCFERTAPELTLSDIQNVARADAGIKTIATGIRKRDSMFRARSRRFMDAGEMLSPLWDWTTFDCVAYLKIHKIPLPPSDGRPSTGIGLTSEAVLWLHDQYPDDYALFLKTFPFAGAIVERRTAYGIGPRYDGAAQAQASTQAEG